METTTTQLLQRLERDLKADEVVILYEDRGGRLQQAFVDYHLHTVRLVGLTSPQLVVHHDYEPAISDVTIPLKDIVAIEATERETPSSVEEAEEWERSGWFAGTVCWLRTSPDLHRLPF